ncbi:hydroxymethylbilane synthase [Methanospirillum lacunae]|uniref:Hydroxymethylbilane synthase n=1 Tax=Methanospirillum lacunae TaxID=668570 RepID=A0A2V2MPW4_9EURY|nr:hydroxymethylbilane synthase [Methanospirillum lacunae]PWR70142.1 hydroxymethylbilane synthase [Methanospirillum lacunae]
MHLKIGTRSSMLARAQAEKVAGLLEKEGVTTELVFISTVGDEKTGVPLHEIGGQGVFVRALDDALINREIDIAVHSMKDIPAERPEGLTTSAILKRDSPADYVVTEKDHDAIRVIGTSSTRRTAQLKRNWSGISILPLRGNVDTRLGKLKAGEYDAIVLAEAGLQRLSLSLPGFRLDPTIHVPSTNQGTIAVVSRNEPPVRGILATIDDEITRTDTLIERAVMEEIGGGCYTPLGIFCKDRHLITEVLSLEGDRVFRLEQKISDLDQAHAFGTEIRKGGRELIDEAYLRLGLSHD